MKQTAGVFIHDFYQGVFGRLIDKYNLNVSLTRDVRTGSFYSISTEDEKALEEISKLETLSKGKLK
jgi:hypothetical protein